MHTFSASHYSSRHTSPALRILISLAVDPLRWESALGRCYTPIIPVCLHQCRQRRAANVADPQVMHTSSRTTTRACRLVDSMDRAYRLLAILGWKCTWFLAEDMYHPLFLPTQDSDTAQTYPWRGPVTTSGDRSPWSREP